MRILIIVEPERTDWYQYLKLDVSNDYLLLWYEGRSDIPQWIRKESFFKEIYYWGEFLTPGHLLKKIRPDRIVFFEIIDQRQIALLVTANKKFVKTFYLEHGAAGDREAAIKRADERNFFIKKKSHYLVKRFKGAFGKMVKSKFFYYSAAFQLVSLISLVKYCRLPFAMLFDTPNKALANCLFAERTPAWSIVFNRPNFEQFQVYTGITEDKAVFSGVPIFDNYYLQKAVDRDLISYIEHPYLEEGILNWTPEHHQQIAQHLFQFAESRQTKVLVKLHPRSDLSLWQRYGFNSPFFEVVQSGDFTKQLLESKLILSYSSSMVNGFLCAQKNVVLLGWHPEPGIVGADFSKTGLCYLSLSSDDLEKKIDYWLANNLALDNKFKYQEFLKEFNYPFDGQAGQRVLRAIHSL